jgi:hypothetical protein
MGLMPWEHQGHFYVDIREHRSRASARLSIGADTAMPRLAKTLNAAIRGDVRAFPVRVRGVIELANGPRCRAVRDLFYRCWDERARWSQTLHGFSFTQSHGDRMLKNLARETQMDRLRGSVELIEKDMATFH